MVDVFVASMQCGGQIFSMSENIDCFNGMFSITAYRNRGTVSQEPTRLLKKCVHKLSN
jgi:hypothetical protein